MPVLTDAQRAKSKAAIAAVKLSGARPRKTDRRAIEAIILRLDNAAKWWSIPTEPGGTRSWRMSWPRSRGWHSHASTAPWRGRTRRRLARDRINRHPLSLRFNRENYPDKQAFGRSRGGFFGKIVGVCNAAGRLVDFVRLAGQTYEFAASLQPLKRLPSTCLGDCLRRGGLPLGSRGDGRDPGRAVAQRRQTETAMPWLYLSSPAT